MEVTTQDYLRYFSLLRTNPAIGLDFLKGVVLGNDEAANDFCQDPAAMMAVFRSKFERAGDREFLKVMNDSPHLLQAVKTFAGGFGVPLTGDLDRDLADQTLVRKIAECEPLLRVFTSCSQLWDPLRANTAAVNTLSAYGEFNDAPQDAVKRYKSVSRFPYFALPEEAVGAQASFEDAVHTPDGRTIYLLHNTSRLYLATADFETMEITLLGYAGIHSAGAHTGMAVSDDWAYIAVPHSINNNLACSVFLKSEGYRTAHAIITDIRATNTNFQATIEWDKENRVFWVAARTNNTTLAILKANPTNFTAVSVQTTTLQYYTGSSWTSFGNGSVSFRIVSEVGKIIVSIQESGYSSIQMYVLDSVTREAYRHFGSGTYVPMVLSYKYDKNAKVLTIYHSGYNNQQVCMENKYLLEEKCFANTSTLSLNATIPNENRGYVHFGVNLWCNSKYIYTPASPCLLDAETMRPIPGASLPRGLYDKAGKYGVPLGVYIYKKSSTSYSSQNIYTVLEEATL